MQNSHVVKPLADILNGFSLNEAQRKIHPSDLEVLRKQALAHPDCKMCASLYETGTHFSPRHDASRFCRSGKRPHCTCDTCF